jgi:endonuclease YncB( thermonuclease family)
VFDGCFIDDDSFQMAPGFMLEDLKEAFQYEVFLSAHAEPYKVIRVVDGDTIVVNFHGKKEKIRLLNVDTTEGQNSTAIPEVMPSTPLTADILTVKTAPEFFPQNRLH